MTWRLARSLVQLRDEVNRLAPARSKVSDGTIGDPKHASRASRHNPNRHGVVCALDLTDDPAGGCAIHQLARRIATRPHPNLEYIISNGEIAKRRNSFRWEPYTGSNAHTRHAHFAVGTGPDSDPAPPYDDTSPWLASAAVNPAPATPRREDDPMFTDVVTMMQVFYGYPADPAAWSKDQRTACAWWFDVAAAHGVENAAKTMAADARKLGRIA